MKKLHRAMQIAERLLILAGVVFFSAMLTTLAIECIKRQGF
tara:strand:+ start:1406 stop:1528 length:123 start_codon:yes stop_codon:yes gene_type:complete